MERTGKELLVFIKEESCDGLKITPEREESDPNEKGNHEIGKWLNQDDHIHRESKPGTFLPEHERIEVPKIETVFRDEVKIDIQENFIEDTPQVNLARSLLPHAIKYEQDDTFQGYASQSQAVNNGLAEIHLEDAKTHQCIECRFLCRKETNLWKHSMLTHGKNIKLTKANRKTKPDVPPSENPIKHRKSSRAPLKKTSNKKEEVFRCSECSYSTKWKENLNRHFEVNHNTGAKEFRCSECPFKTKHKHYLKHHFLVIHDTEAVVFRCFSCSYNTKLKHQLSRHFEINHKNQGEVFECSECSYKTKVKCYLKQHFQYIHDKDAKVFQCCDCPYNTKRKQSLVQHFHMSHNEEVSLFRCSECSFQTKRKFNLQKHFDVKHNKEPKMFRCSECSFDTKYKACLRRHFRLIHVKRADAV